MLLGLGFNSWRLVRAFVRAGVFDRWIKPRSANPIARPQMNVINRSLIVFSASFSTILAHFSTTQPIGQGV